MPDTTTLNETARAVTAIDGTEYVRLATTGANWKALLSNIFKSLGRERLIAARNYYIRTDGSDSNDGLTNTAGGAWLTLQHAADALDSIDAAGQNITINVGAGTYTAGVTLIAAWLGGGSVKFLGDETTPDNVVVSVASGNCFAVNTPLPGILYITGFKLAAAAGTGVYVPVAGGSINLGAIDWGACATAHVYINAPGAYVSAYAAQTITGAAAYHIIAAVPGATWYNATAHTLSGILAFTYFAFTSGHSVIIDSGGYTGGTITGTRYAVTDGSLINTNGGGANYFPGNVAGVGGTTVGGGIYE